MLVSNGAYPIITKPTRVTPLSSTLLDHVITNVITKTITPGIITSDISDHYPVFCISTTKLKRKSSMNYYFYRDNKKFDVTEFREDLSELLHCFSTLVTPVSNNNIAFLFAEFVKIFKCVIDKHAPFKRASRKQRKLIQKPWITKGIFKSIKNKQKLYKSHFLEGTSEQKLNYKKYVNKLRKLKLLSKKSYYRNEFVANKNDKSKLWQTENSLLHSKVNMATVCEKLEIDSNIIDDPQVIVEEFNKHFCTVGQSIADSIDECSRINPNTSNNDNFDGRVSSSLFLTPTDPHEIQNVIYSLSTKEAGGCDGISAFYLHAASEVIAPILSTLINQCLLLGVFPDCLKVGKVIPLFKSGSKTSKFNYRPVSLLTSISKVFEKIIYKRFMKFFETNSIFAPTQYGFRRNCSTSHAVLDVITTTYDNLNERLYTALIMLDLKKAFDSVNHQIILKKLDKYGVRGIPHRLINSYLTNRKQYVAMNNYHSSLKLVKCGVPQESLLGPLLFLVFINDLPYCSLNITPRLYADDTCLIISNDNLNGLEGKANSELSTTGQYKIR